ncbi:MAG: efflux RND transporter periplasmic adaptor subunit [bacterium]
MMKKVVVPLLVLCLLGGGAYYFWGPKKESGERFKTIAVTRGDMKVTVEATGVVAPDNRLEIKPPIGGRIDQVLIKEGEAVNKGQILAWISSTERSVLLDAAEAKGPKEVDHWKDLFKPSPIIASINGILIARNIEPGQTVTAQDPIFVVSDRLIVRAQVDETDIGSVKLGQKASFTLDAYPGQTIEGKVSRIAYEGKIVNNVTTYEVDVLPDKVPDFMRSQMTANVTFLISTHPNVLILPSEALRVKDGKTTVFLPNPEGKGKPIAQEVQTGLSDGKRTEIISGLQEGEKISVPLLRFPKSAGPASGSPLSPMGGGARPPRR